MHCYTIDSEKFKASDFSPCPVENNEYLLRITLHPEHIDNGQILSSAISTTDLESRGYSVERKKYTDISKICEKARNQIQRKPESRESAEIAEMLCEDIRSLQFNQERAFLVIDDALEDNIAHASIYAAIKPCPKSILRQLRNQLTPFLENRTEPNLTSE